MLVVDLFEHMMEHPQDFLNVNKGEDFEDGIMKHMRTNLTFTRITVKDVPGINNLKSTILDYSNPNFIDNTTGLEDMFIFQPFGSQQYPDFLVFEKKYILPVEAKFSKKGTRPMWNSGLPRSNGLYVYGAREHEKIVVFCGADIVSLDESIRLHNFFSKLKKLENEFNQEYMSNQEYGFVVYSRKAFEQSRKVNPDAQLSLVNDAKILGEKLLARLKSMAN